MYFSYFGGFTLDVISSTAFGLEVDSLNNPDNPFIKHVQEIFSPPKGIPWKRFTFLAASMFPSLCGIMKYFEINFWPRESIRFFVRECKAMVEDRRKETRSQTDFLQLMINSEAEDTSETQNGVKSQTTTLQKRLTTDEIIGQAFLFFIAGYETTASLLRFTAYELAIHQDVQEKVVKEINDKLGDEEPNYENINKLQYLEQVLFETLRLFPPLSRLNRAVSEDISIKGMTFPKGSAVFIPVTRIHHDPEFYPNPEEFNPERFEDSKSVQNKFIFMPFGLGPRMCIGMRLALVEAKIALVHVLRRIKFDKSPNTEV
ncbi:hypothetical protein FSP39_001444 [Pinctada imbricata]|uniref:Cytochrome P450 n=1 Tax=Pinctada imbricata TaxID=66713 RepID=A0AA88YK63_PINIB|nr:hypothetical protein FSP39_001444 [Pinctada imbricata]